MVVFLFMTTRVHCQSDFKLQGLFLYNFTRLVSWPDDYRHGDFVIAVFGNSPISREIEQIAVLRRAGNQPIVSQLFNNLEEISKCHILYIPAS